MEGEAPSKEQTPGKSSTSENKSRALEGKKAGQATL